MRRLLALLPFAVLIAFGRPCTVSAATTVNCNQNQSLAQAVAFALSGTTLQFSGTCAGPVTINQSNLTLDGRGSGIVDGGGAANAIIVNGVHGVTLARMTVQHGVSGVVVQAGGVATLTGLTVTGNAFDGVLITGNSSATLSNSVLSGTPVNGVDVESTSSVIFTGKVQSSGAVAFGINIALVLASR